MCRPGSGPEILTFERICVRVGRNSPREGIVPLFADGVFGAAPLVLLEMLCLHLFTDAPELLDRTRHTVGHVRSDRLNGC